MSTPLRNVFLQLMLSVLLPRLPMFAADPFLGAWKLYVAQSRLPGQNPPASMTMVWAASSACVKVTTEGVYTGGAAFGGEYIACYDGVETVRKGPWNWDTVTNKQISEREREDTFKKDGKAAGKARNLVSEDGNRLTIDIQYGGSRTTRVFDRQK